MCVWNTDLVDIQDRVSGDPCAAASIGLDQGLQAALDFGSCYCCWVAFLLLLPVVVVVAAEEEAVAVAVRRIPAHKDWGLLVP